MNPPIRVLHVFGVMDMGGAETLVMNIFRNIDRTKIQFDFMVHSKKKGFFDEEIKSLGGNIYYVPKYNVINHGFYWYKWESFFQKHNQHKIIHGHVRSTASIYLKIAKKHNKKTIAHSHSTSSGRGLSAHVKNILQKSIINYAEYFFACSEEAGRWLFGEEITGSQKFKVFKNAIDLSKFFIDNGVREDIRTKLNLEDKLVIGHIGSFKDEKNHKFLIDVFNDIHKSNPQARLVLIGDGKLKSPIVRYVEQKELEEFVFFLGVQREVNSLLQAMDVFVFPSKFEGLGIAVIESQAAGIPTIVSTAIPKEAIASELVDRLSLKEPTALWASCILEKSKLEKKDVTEQLAKSGYCLKDITLWLSNFYLSLNK